MAPSRPALLVAALVLATLLVPVAGADHVFSHRTYVVGRVLDPEGRPAAGVPVGIVFANLTPGGRCFDSRDEATGPQGDFTLCRHTHRLPHNVSVTVTAGNASATVPLDADLRVAVARLQLAEPAPGRDIAGDRLFGRTYHVQGRAFTLLQEPVEVENVPVNATPRAGANVTVRLASGTRTLAETVVSIDEMGTYRADLPLDGPVPADARVHVQSGNVAASEKASPLFRRSDVNLLRESPREVPLDEVPGSSPTPVPALAPLAALGLAGLLGARQRRRVK